MQVRGERALAAKTKGGGVRAEGMLSGMFGFAAPALAGGGRIELLGWP